MRSAPRMASASTALASPGAPGGFTMIEVIMVLVIMGVLSAVAVSSMNADNTLVYEFTTLKTHVRYAQARAMGLNTEIGIRCQGGSYWLFSGASTGNRELLPGQSADSVSLASSVTPGTFTLAFDGRGRPYSSNVLSSGNRLSTPFSVSVARSGESRSFSVTDGTGYVP